MWYQPSFPVKPYPLLVSKRIATVLFVLHAGWLLGCATAPGQDSSRLPATPGAEREPANARTPDTGSATLALLRQSERANRAGEHHEAVGYIERAIRLNPLQADLWTALALLHLNNDDPENALRFANKAVALAGRRADWLRDAWLVIADVKAQQGNEAQAHEIRKRWRSYRG